MTRRGGVLVRPEPSGSNHLFWVLHYKVVPRTTVIKAMTKIIVNYKITPENAGEFGLIWDQDYIYDPEAPTGVNRNIEEMIEQGIVLGSPATPGGEENHMVGLYKKIAGLKTFEIR